MKFHASEFWIKAGQKVRHNVTLLPLKLHFNKLEMKPAKTTQPVHRPL